MYKTLNNSITRKEISSHKCVIYVAQKWNLIIWRNIFAQKAKKYYIWNMLQIYYYVLIIIVSCSIGLYLYLLVVKTFTGDSIKLKLCLVIGWGEWVSDFRIGKEKSHPQNIKRNDD